MYYRSLWSVISASLPINIASVSANGLDLSLVSSVCLYCGKTVDWIRMPFGMVSAVCRGMGVLDGVDNRRMKGNSFGGKFGASRCNQQGLCCVVVRERRALPKLLQGGVVIYILF